MDIIDVHIVRIISLSLEADLTLDTQFPCDHSSYADGYPKRQSWNNMVAYILNIVFNQKIYSESVSLRADVPYVITFPVPFETTYTIVLGFARSQIQAGVTITNETLNGFTITPIGEDVTVDIICVPKTTLV